MQHKTKLTKHWHSLSLLKTTLVFILFLLYFNCIQAQNDTISKKRNKGSFIISVAGGIAKPAGDFDEFEKHSAITDTSRSIIGNAKLGYNAKVDAKYMFNKYFGMSLMYGYSENSTDTKGIPIPSTPQTVYNTNNHYWIENSADMYMLVWDSGSWYINRLLLGLNASYKIKFISINLKFGAGIQQAKSPGVYSNLIMHSHGHNATYDDSFANEHTIQPIMKSNGFAENSGFDINFHIGRRFIINLSFEEYYSKASFNGTQTYSESKLENLLNYNPPYMWSREYNEEQNYQRDISFEKVIFLYCYNIGLSYVIK